MTNKEIEELLHTLEVFFFKENDDHTIEQKFTYVEKKLGFSLAESYKICMRNYKKTESAYRHLIPIEEILDFVEIEKQEIAIPHGFYVLEYLDDITMLQNSKGEIFISMEEKPLKYADNLEIYLRDKWNNNVVENIMQNAKFSVENPYTLEEIDEAEKVLQLNFAADFREYLRSFSFVGVEDRRLLTMLEVVEETLKARRDDFIFPKNSYVIQQNSEEYITIIQNSNGIIYELAPYKNKVEVGNSLAQYIMEEMI